MGQRRRRRRRSTTPPNSHNNERLGWTNVGLTVDQHGRRREHTGFEQWLNTGLTLHIPHAGTMEFNNNKGEEKFPFSVKFVEEPLNSQLLEHFHGKIFKFNARREI